MKIEMTEGLTGIAALEAEMRDRLAAKNKDIVELTQALTSARADIQEAQAIRAVAVKMLTGEAVKAALAELQAYCDERARRWAVVKERATAPMSKMVADAQMREALVIGLHVARLMLREKTT